MKKVIIIIILLSFNFSCSSPDYFENGKILFKKGEYFKARINFIQVQNKSEKFDSAKILINICDYNLYVADSTKRVEKKRINDSLKIVKKKRDTEELIYKINTEIKAIDNFTSSIYRGSVTSLNLEILYFSEITKLINKGKKHNNKKIKKLSETLKKKLKNLQWREFPKIRKAYVEILDDKLWEENIDVFCKGKRYTTMEFVGGIFASNKNIKDTQFTMHEKVNDFRFKRVNYKWYKYDDEYTYYTINSISDGELKIY